MANTFLNQRGAIAALAAGAGVLVGAVGVLIYNQIANQRTQNEMHTEIIDLGQSIEKIQKELESVRKNIIKASDKRRNRLISSNASVTSEMYSANEDDDEFFDISSDQEDTLSNTGNDVTKES